LQFTVKLHTLLGAFPPNSVYFGHSLPLLFLFFRLADIHGYALLIGESPGSESALRNALRVGQTFKLRDFQESQKDYEYQGSHYTHLTFYIGFIKYISIWTAISLT